VGKIALASLLAESLARGDGAAPPAANPLAVRPPHYAPRAKRVIHLFMAGRAEPTRPVRQQTEAHRV